jgi:hypothetical protein
VYLEDADGLIERVVLVFDDIRIVDGECLGLSLVTATDWKLDVCTLRARMKFLQIHEHRPCYKAI